MASGFLSRLIFIIVVSGVAIIKQVNVTVMATTMISVGTNLCAICVVIIMATIDYFGVLIIIIVIYCIYIYIYIILFNMFILLLLLVIITGSNFLVIVILYSLDIQSRCLLINVDIYS